MFQNANGLLYSDAKKHECEAGRRFRGNELKGQSTSHGVVDRSLTR